jgi:predicted MFS family arabinose efflux permease
LIDRVGKRRGSQLGLLLLAGLFLLLPLTQKNLLWVKLMLVSLGALFEFSIVSLLPLYSEQVPEARATVFSLVALGVSLGAGIGSPVTAALWEWKGLQAVCAVAVVSLSIALMLVWRFLPELTSPTPHQ